MQGEKGDERRHRRKGDIKSDKVIGCLLWMGQYRLSG